MGGGVWVIIVAPVIPFSSNAGYYGTPCPGFCEECTLCADYCLTGFKGAERIRLGLCSVFCRPSVMLQLQVLICGWLSYNYCRLRSIDVCLSLTNGADVLSLP